MVLLGDLDRVADIVACLPHCFVDVHSVRDTLVMDENVTRRFDFGQPSDLIFGWTSQLSKAFQILKPAVYSPIDNIGDTSSDCGTNDLSFSGESRTV